MSSAADTTSRKTALGLRATDAPALAMLAFGLLLLCALFFPEGHAAVTVWDTSTAYGHCYLVLPMAAYLAWDRRRSLAGIPICPQPALALLALPVAAGWLVAERLGIMEGRQLMAIAAMEVLFLVVLGWRLFHALLGPLLYLFFLVPFGSFLTPGLQQFTARFTVVGLNLLGIPNFSDDLIIEIPEGTFYVAEACAGLRFLIAAIAFGVFYALLNYRSPARRAAFIGASMVVPIIANGFRALGIVVLGRVLGSAEAAAADHVIYGWVFFSIVMLLLVAAGLPLREDPAAAPPALPIGMLPSHRAASPLWGVLAVCLLTATGPAVARVLDRQTVAAPLAALPALTLPEECKRLGEPSPSAASDGATANIECDGTAMHVSLQTFPARSTATALSQARRRATGELEAEDAEYSPLRVAGDANGTWSLVQTFRPFRATALAAWVNGAPAPAGLRGRLELARNSVFGSDHASVLMVITTELDGRLAPDRRQALLELIRKLIDAQPGLTAEVAALSRARL